MLAFMFWGYLQAKPTKPQIWPAAEIVDNSPYLLDLLRQHIQQ